jgi:hypothetical protein
VARAGARRLALLQIGVQHRPRVDRRPWRTTRLPDGSDRFIVDEALLLSWTENLDGRLADPLKTTVVQGMRSMTTWCLIK